MGKDAKESGDKYSLRGKVYDRIREDILNGVYKEHEELKEATLNADFIVHLDGVNRPKDTKEFYEGNGGLTEKIVEYLTKV